MTMARTVRRIKEPEVRQMSVPEVAAVTGAGT
jgi:hypothetical protein